MEGAVAKWLDEGIGITEQHYAQHTINCLDQVTTLPFDSIVTFYAEMDAVAAKEEEIEDDA